MTNAQFIFNALTKIDMIHVVAFMEENKTCSLNDALIWLYKVIIIEDKDFIILCEREHDVSYAAYMKQYRIDTLFYSGCIEDGVIPF